MATLVRLDSVLQVFSFTLVFLIAVLAWNVSDGQTETRIDFGFPKMDEPSWVGPVSCQLAEEESCRVTP